MDDRELRQLGRDLLESDQRFFEAAAIRHEIRGGQISELPGFADVAAGCVVHRLRPAEIVVDSEDWLSMIEQRVLGLGCRRLRLYLDAPLPRLDQLLAERGFRRREESGFYLPALPSTSASVSIELRPIETERDWQDKIDLHAADTRAMPDGHPVAADRWVAMERTKAEASDLSYYLALRDGQICGTVGVMNAGRLLRMKNLYIHSSWRRTGMGSAIVRRFQTLSQSQGMRGVGLFALEKKPAMQFYQRLGARIITRQYEWVKEETATLPG